MKKLSVSDYLIYTFAFTIAIILIAQIVGVGINVLK